MRTKDEESDGRWPVFVMLFVYWSFLVYILKITQLDVDDGSGFESILKDVKARNAKISDLHQEHMDAMWKRREEKSLQTYQGDSRVDLNKLSGLSDSSMNGLSGVKPTSIEDLETKVQQSIVAYLHRYHDEIQSVSTHVDLLNKKNPVIEKLRKRQVFVENLFADTYIASKETFSSELPFIYNSILSNPALIVPRHPPIDDGMLSKVGSLFGWSATAQQENGGTFANTRGISTELSASFENVLSGLGYQRHSSASGALPLWLNMFGKKCPSSDSMLSKEGGESHPHVVFCAAYTIGRHLVQDEKQELSQFQLKHSAALKSLVEQGLSAHAFYSVVEDSDILKSKHSPFLMVQGPNGKPQLLKDISPILGNPKYNSVSLNLLASEYHNDLLLFQDHNAFVIRSYLVIASTSPLLVYSVSKPDILVSSQDFSPYTETSPKESYEKIVSSRLPSFDSSSSLVLSDIDMLVDDLVDRKLLRDGDEFHAKVIPKIQRMMQYVALTKFVVVPHDNAVNRIQHVCVDFTLGQGLTLNLFSFSSDCPIQLATQPTRDILMEEVVHVAQNLLNEKDSFESAKLTKLIDEKTNYVATFV